MEGPQEDIPANLHADELQEIVVLCDSDGIIMYWNRAGEEITGSTRDEVIGYHVETILTADSRAALAEVMRIEHTWSVLPGIPVRLQTKFGWDVPAEVTSVQRRLAGGGPGFLFIFRDLTLKTQLQEQLDRMDLLYRGLVEGSPDLIYVLDAGARVLFINDTVSTLLGYSKKDLIGKELIDIVHPEDRQYAYWPLWERRLADRATRNLRLRLLTRDGQDRRYDLGFVWVSLDSVGLGRRAAEPSKPMDEHLGTQGVARDVTELILLQEFTQGAELILPVCSVCHKIRTGVGEQSEWVPLAEYVERKTGVQYSHTYCPEHVPPV